MEKQTSENAADFKPSSVKSFLVTGLGMGFLPIAPGTWGSAAACVVYFSVLLCSDYSQAAALISLVVMAAVSSYICISFGDYAEKRFGKKDPGAVTTDEWAGQAVTLAFLPAATGLVSAMWIVIIAFFAFRLFDIVKIPPARQLEKLPKGTGVLLDDIAAGVYANIACQIILRLWGGLFGL